MKGVGWVGNSKLYPSVQLPPPTPNVVAANFYLVSPQTVFLLRNRTAQYKYILQRLSEAQNHPRTVESSTNPTPLFTQLTGWREKIKSQTIFWTEMHVDIRLFSPKLVPEKNVEFSLLNCVILRSPLPSLPKKNPIGDGKNGI